MRGTGYTWKMLRDSFERSWTLVSFSGHCAYWVLISQPSTAPHDVVFAAEELRYAAQAVGKITGRVDVEDILDAIFKDFCIGK